MRSSPTYYLICATSRSGSTLLCEALTSTGIAGYPDEYLSLANSTLREQTWVEQRNRLQYHDYLRWLVGSESTPNHVFGLKFTLGALANMRESLAAFPEYENLDDLGLLEHFFPGARFIFVTRRDKIAQAVSLFKAQQTNSWNSLNASSSTAAPRFSYLLINDCLQDIVESEAAWARFFRGGRIVPHVVTYEDLALDYAGTTRAVLDYLGITAPPELDFSKRRLQKQSDTTNAAWIERFHRYKRLEGRLSTLLGLPTIVRNPYLADWYLWLRLGTSAKQLLPEHLHPLVDRILPAPKIVASD